MPTLTQEPYHFLVREQIIMNAIRGQNFFINPILLVENLSSASLIYPPEKVTGLGSVSSVYPFEEHTI